MKNISVNDMSKAFDIFSMICIDGFFLLPLSKWHKYPTETPEISDNLASVIPFCSLILLT